MKIQTSFEFFFFLRFWWSLADYEIKEKKIKTNNQLRTCQRKFQLRRGLDTDDFAFVFFAFLFFFFNSSCIGHGTWTVHLGLQIVTRTVQSRGLHYARDIVHYSRDPKPLYSEKIFKMGPIVLFTCLKIILLQYF